LQSWPSQKNLTPLLKIKKIDFALVFAINEQQLRGIVCEVLPALQKDAKFWVAYPKIASKIATTLNRDCSWECITGNGYEVARQEALDHVWTAIRFIKGEPVAVLEEEQEELLEAAGVGVLPRRSKVASHKLLAGKKSSAVK